MSSAYIHPYLLLLLIASFAALALLVKSPRMTDFFCVVQAAVGAYVVGERGTDAGFDTAVYRIVFNLIQSPSPRSIPVGLNYLGGNHDFTFGVLAWVTGQLGGSFALLLWLLPFLSGVLIWFGVWFLEKEVRVLGFFAFLVSNSYIALYGNAVRQGLAMAFTLAALGARLRGSKFGAVILVVMAMFSHKFGYLAVLTLFPLERFRRSFLYVITCICALGGLLGAPSLIPGLSAFYSAGANSVGWGHPLFLSFLVFVLFYEFALVGTIKLDPSIRVVFAMAMCGFAVQCLFGGSFWGFHRFSLFRFAFEPFLYCHFVRLIKPRHDAVCLVFALIFLFGIAVMHNPANVYMLGNYRTLMAALGP